MSKIILECIYCGELVERSRPTPNPSCFTCKQDMKMRRYRQDPRLTRIKSPVPEVEKNLSRKKVFLKNCEYCNVEMHNVHFTKRFCSGKCQQLNNLKKHASDSNTTKL